ncbi:COG4223 family protein [Aliiroseovarius sp. PTFE2010]|uniref:COG4223 family protein n=1 Tax=Aliiroseovarius sp. PTFE2010 TaxID=3417190 RepID=UPI003CE8E523
MASSKKKSDSDPKDLGDQETDTTQPSDDIAPAAPSDATTDADDPTSAETLDNLADEEQVSAESAESEPSIVDVPDEPADVETQDDGAISGQPEPIAPKKRSGVWGGIFGGAIAAALGAAATYFVLPLVPGLLPNPADDPQELAIAQLQDETSGLSNRVASNSQSIDQLTGNVAELDVDADLAALHDQISALQERVIALEERPVPSSAPSAETMQAVDAELGKLRAQVEDELQRIKEASAQVAENEQAAEERALQAAALAALGRIQIAADAGRPFADDLDPVRDAGIELPEALQNHATEGVATLSALQSSFPQSARSALNAAIDAEAPEDPQSKVSAFFRKQLGVRSLEPRDGDSADAILSRAEAALRDGDLAKTLEELSGLSGEAEERMNSWIAKAKARMELKTALDTLAQQLSQ